MPLYADELNPKPFNNAANAKADEHSGLGDLLGQAAIFIENYIDDHYDSYEGEDDELLIQDRTLAEALRAKAATLEESAEA